MAGPRCAYPPQGRVPPLVSLVGGASQSQTRPPAARGRSLCGRCVPVRAGRGPPRPPGRRGQRGSQDGWLGGACVPSSARSRSDPHTATPRPGRGSPGQEGGCSTYRLSPSPHSGCPQRPTAPRGAVRGGVAPAPARTPHPPSPVPSGGESGLEAGGGRGFPPWPCRAGGWGAYAACVSSRLGGASLGAEGQAGFCACEGSPRARTSGGPLPSPRPQLPASSPRPPPAGPPALPHPLTMAVPGLPPGTPAGPATPQFHSDSSSD